MKEVGRPKYFENGVDVKFRTDKQTREQLQQDACSKSLTLSRLISHIVDAYLEEKK